MHMTDRALHRLVDRPGMSLKVYNTVRLKVQAENIDHGLMQATVWLHQKTTERRSLRHHWISGLSHLSRTEIQDTIMQLLGRMVHTMLTVRPLYDFIRVL